MKLELHHHHRGDNYEDIEGKKKKKKTTNRHRLPEKGPSTVSLTKGRGRTQTRAATGVVRGRDPTKPRTPTVKEFHKLSTNVVDFLAQQQHYSSSTNTNRNNNKCNNNNSPMGLFQRVFRRTRARESSSGGKPNNNGGGSFPVLAEHLNLSSSKDNLLASTEREDSTKSLDTRSTSPATTATGSTRTYKRGASANPPGGASAGRRSASSPRLRYYNSSGSSAINHNKASSPSPKVSRYVELQMSSSNNTNKGHRNNNANRNAAEIAQFQTTFKNLDPEDDDLCIAQASAVSPRVMSYTSSSSSASSSSYYTTSSASSAGVLGILSPDTSSSCSNHSYSSAESSSSPRPIPKRGPGPDCDPVITVPAKSPTTPPVVTTAIPIPSYTSPAISVPQKVTPTRSPTPLDLDDFAVAQELHHTHCISPTPSRTCGSDSPAKRRYWEPKEEEEDEANVTDDDIYLDDSRCVSSSTEGKLNPELERESLDASDSDEDSNDSNYVSHIKSTPVIDILSDYCVRTRPIYNTRYDPSRTPTRDGSKRFPTPRQHSPRVRPHETRRTSSSLNARQEDSPEYSPRLDLPLARETLPPKTLFYNTPPPHRQWRKKGMTQTSSGKWVLVETVMDNGGSESVASSSVAEDETNHSLCEQQEMADRYANELMRRNGPTPAAKTHHSVSRIDTASPIPPPPRTRCPQQQRPYQHNPAFWELLDAVEKDLVYSQPQALKTIPRERTSQASSVSSLAASEQIRRDETSRASSSSSLAASEQIRRDETSRASSSSSLAASGQIRREQTSQASSSSLQQQRRKSKWRTPEIQKMFESRNFTAKTCKKVPCLTLYGGDSPVANNGSKKNNTRPSLAQQRSLAYRNYVTAYKEYIHDRKNKEKQQAHNDARNLLEMTKSI